MSRGISLSSDEGTFITEAVSLSIEEYNTRPDTERVTLQTQAVYKALGWPWKKERALAITAELERKGLIVFVKRTAAVGNFHVTDQGTEVAGYF